MHEFNEQIDSVIRMRCINCFTLNFVISCVLQVKSTPLRPFIPSHRSSSSAALQPIDKLHWLTPVADTYKGSLSARIG